jgi:hypothetical protein
VGVCRRVKLCEVTVGDGRYVWTVHANPDKWRFSALGLGEDLKTVHLANIIKIKVTL